LKYSKVASLKCADCGQRGGVDALPLDEILQTRKNFVAGAEHNDERTLSVGLMEQSGLHGGLQ
jgi:hypothetical protein